MLMTIVKDTSRLEVRSMGASEQLYDVVVTNCDKLLTADSLHLICAKKCHIVVRAKYLLDCVVSQIYDQAIFFSATAKAYELMFVYNSNCSLRPI